jgi:hypothetical protein
MPLQFNLQPLAIIQLLSIASQVNGVNLGPLTQLFQFIIANPAFHPPVSQIAPYRLISYGIYSKIGHYYCRYPSTHLCQVRRTDYIHFSIDTLSSGQQFDVNGAILKTLQGLKVDLAVESSVKLDDCRPHFLSN